MWSSTSDSSARLEGFGAAQLEQRHAVRRMRSVRLGLLGDRRHEQAAGRDIVDGLGQRDEVVILHVSAAPALPTAAEPAAAPPRGCAAAACLRRSSAASPTLPPAYFRGLPLPWSGMEGGGGGCCSSVT